MNPAHKNMSQAQSTILGHVTVGNTNSHITDTRCIRPSEHPIGWEGTVPRDSGELRRAYAKQTKRNFAGSSLALFVCFRRFGVSVSPSRSDSLGDDHKQLHPGRKTPAFLPIRSRNRRRANHNARKVVAIPPEPNENGVFVHHVLQPPARAVFNATASLNQGRPSVHILAARGPYAVSSSLPYLLILVNPTKLRLQNSNVMWRPGMPQVVHTL